MDNLPANTHNENTSSITLFQNKDKNDYNIVIHTKPITQIVAIEGKFLLTFASDDSIILNKINENDIIPLHKVCDIGNIQGFFLDHQYNLFINTDERDSFGINVLTLRIIEKQNDFCIKGKTILRHSRIMHHIMHYNLTFKNIIECEKKYGENSFRINSSGTHIIQATENIIYIREIGNINFPYSTQFSRVPNSEIWFSDYLFAMNIYADIIINNEKTYIRIIWENNIYLIEIFFQFKDLSDIYFSPDGQFLILLNNVKYQRTESLYIPELKNTKLYKRIENTKEGKFFYFDFIEYNQIIKDPMYFYETSSFINLSVYLIINTPLRAIAPILKQPEYFNNIKQFSYSINSKTDEKILIIKALNLKFYNYNSNYLKDGEIDTYGRWRNVKKYYKESISKFIKLPQNIRDLHLISIYDSSLILIKIYPNDDGTDLTDLFRFDLILFNLIDESQICLDNIKASEEEERVEHPQNLFYIITRNIKRTFRVENLILFDLERFFIIVNINDKSYKFLPSNGIDSIILRENNFNAVRKCIGISNNTVFFIDSNALKKNKNTSSIEYLNSNNLNFINFLPLSNYKIKERELIWALNEYIVFYYSQKHHLYLIIYNTVTQKHFKPPAFNLFSKIELKQISIKNYYKIVASNGILLLFYNSFNGNLILLNIDTKKVELLSFKLYYHHNYFFSFENHYIVKIYDHTKIQKYHIGEKRLLGTQYVLNNKFLYAVTAPPEFENQQYFWTNCFDLIQVIIINEFGEKMLVTDEDMKKTYIKPFNKEDIIKAGFIIYNHDQFFRLIMKKKQNLKNSQKRVEVFFNIIDQTAQRNAIAFRVQEDLNLTTKNKSL